MKIASALFVATALAAVPGAAFAQDPAVAVVARQGRPLYGSNGARIGAIYRVAVDGSPQVIMDDRLVTVPAATVSDQGGKITTTLTRKDLRTAR